MDQSAQRPSAELRRLVDGFQAAQAIHVAAVLGIADRLRDGPRGVDELAADTGTHAPTLYRLLRALAGVGVFDEDDERRFALTSLGDCLRSDASDPVGGWAAFIARPEQWQAWSGLLHSVRTGENAFQHVHGMGPWDYRARHPDAGAAFDRAMTELSRGLNAAILEAVDMARFSALVDVGGGQGALLAALLARRAEARGVLLDLPHVVADAEHVLRAAGVAERCRVVGGNFFEAVPAGGDAYLLKSILHDWDDDRATDILRVCRRAIAPGGTLLVIESEIGSSEAGIEAMFMDLRMLVGPGGRERTRAEYAALFAAAGFRLTQSTPTARGVNVIEGIPV